jgi:hypothetical protein
MTDSGQALDLAALMTMILAVLPGGIRPEFAGFVVSGGRPDPSPAEQEGQMMDWTVHVEAAGPDSAVTDNQVDALEAALEPWHGAVSAGHNRISAQFNVVAGDLVAAASEAVAVWRQVVGEVSLPPWPVTRAEIMTVAEQERELQLPQRFEQ